MVGGSYSFTRAGIANCEQHGITPREIWEVVASRQRMFVPVGHRSRLVAGRTDEGRWLGFLAQESDRQADEWEIVAARELDDQEIKNVRQARGDHDA
jgi:hypothetical protein